MEALTRSDFICRSKMLRYARMAGLGILRRGVDQLVEGQLRAVHYGHHQGADSGLSLQKHVQLCLPELQTFISSRSARLERFAQMAFKNRGGNGSSGAVCHSHWKMIPGYRKSFP
ncbi:MAG: hypothetical protein WBO29_17270 [Albidovulum sp.]